MNTKKLHCCAIWLLLFAAGVANGSEVEVNGVFGLAPMPENAAVAVWVPLNSSESISGVMWYNNDGSRVFPEVLAVAGDAGQPSVLDQGVVVGEDVPGATLGWSYLTFPQALASATPGLFLIFRLPADGAFVTEGVGSGLGYQVGDGQVRCWVSTEVGEWGPLSPDYQMAVSAIMNTSKSSEVRVLGPRGDPAGEDGTPEGIPVPVIAGLSVAPNPFNPQTEILFTLPSKSEVILRIFDVRGREIRTLISDQLDAGEHTAVWNGCDNRGQPQPSGVYLALMEAGSIRLTRRLTLVQ